MALWLISLQAAAEEWSLEYQLKAVVLYNFAKFIQWPAEADGTEPLVIGILGRDPFGPELDKALSEKLAQGRKVKVKRYRAVADVRDCHILFIPRSETNLKRIVDAVEDRGILTVAESEDFLRNGGMIRFYLEEAKVRFEINVDAVKRAHLKLSSQLLNLARIYRERRGP